MKHTQGEWSISNVGQCGCRDIINDLGDPIAFTTGIGNDQEDKANAKLIAAAPDLLQALQIIAQEGIAENESREAWITNVKRIAKAAIKKATE